MAGFQQDPRGRRLAGVCLPVQRGYEGPVYAWAARHLSAMRDLTVRTDESMIIAYVKSEVPLPPAPAGSFVMCDCNDCAGMNEDHACFNRNQWQHKHRV